MLIIPYSAWFAILSAYLCGSISSAIVTCKLMGYPDPRLQGSGNPGATNVLRFGGKKAAIITLVGDTLKGLLVVLAAKWLGYTPPVLSIITLAVFLGHLYPIFFGFKGGKGVATAAGCLLALAWPIGVAAVLTWLSMALLFRYSSLAAIAAALLTPVYASFYTSADYGCLTTAISILLLFRHRHNLRKLWQGKEDKIGRKK